MLIKTSEATGLVLDYLVARVLGVKCHVVPQGQFQGGQLVVDDEWDWHDDCAIELHYSTDWAQGGPIIDREQIGTRPPRNSFTPNGSLVSSVADGWFATTYTEFEGEAMPSISRFGPTPLIAAMRCYVASVLGDEAEVPDDLFEE